MEHLSCSQRMQYNLWSLPSVQMHRDSPSRDSTDGLLVDSDEFIQHHVSCGEHTIGVEEGVEEVDGEETEVGQPLQQTFDAGVADLQHFAGVHHLTEADVHIIAIQTWIWSVGKNAKIRGGKN